MAEITRHAVDIDDLNRKNSENIYKLVSRGEDAYREQVKEIASQILIYKKKIILVSGPSSSGKTTSSFKIQEELRKLKIKSFVINMDKFFNDLDTVPLREDGQPDMEGIVALDVKTIKKCLNDIIVSGKTMIPDFDFKTHKRKKEWSECNVNNDEVIIMEGIHALNPLVTEGLDEDKLYKVYVHCNTNFAYNGKVILQARELRLLRRIVRDDRERHSPYELTIELWPEVCKGEDKNIRPYKNNANYWLNSTHYYEPLLYKQLLQENFLKIKNNEVIKYLLDKFKLFSTIDISFVPKNSLLREFIGK